MAHHELPEVSASEISATPPTWFKPALFFIFTLSGFSGLIYESIWSHYLKLMLGHAAYAQTLVLAIFMGGMALGAWLASHYSKRATNLIMLYALIEGVVGVLALLFHTVFTHTLDVMYLSVIPALGDPTTINILKWTVAALLIFPQSILLGATFPLMSSGIIRLYPKTAGSTLSMLYFTNSIGAAIGVLASGFFLIEQLGLPGTMLTAGLLNIALAIIVYGLAKGRDIAITEVKELTETTLPKAAHLLLLVTFLSSMASFFYEIGWIRMLSLVLGSTTQAFELMLSAFIMGLAFGGLWIRYYIERIASPLRFAGYVQILMGLLAVLTLPLYNYTFDFMGFMINSLSKNEGGYLLFNLTSHTICLVIMIPATFMAGMTLPLFTYSLIKQGGGEKSIGRIYSANTIGAIVGVFLAVHLVMPQLGTQGVIGLGALIDIALGIALLAALQKGNPMPHFATVTAGALFVFAAIVSLARFDQLRVSSGVYRHGVAKLPESTEVLYHRDGKTATVHLLRHRNGHVNILTNGKSDAAVNMKDDKASGDEITMVMAGALPLALHPTAKSIANIGMGSGMTTHTVLGATTVERVDTIEIESAILEGARHFGKFNANAYTDPRSQLHIEDAKTFFSSHNARYDIIISEPSNPWVSGVASLFTEEFYNHVKHHLNENGLLVQWLQLYESNFQLVSSVFKALSGHFKNYLVFNTDEANILIVATNGEFKPLDNWIFSQPQLKTMMQRVGINDLKDLQIRQLGSRATLQALFATTRVPINSDYFPYLSYQAPKSRYLKQDVAHFTGLGNAPLPVMDMLAGFVDTNPMVATPVGFFRKIDIHRAAHTIADAQLNPKNGMDNSADADPFLTPLRFALRLVQLELNSCILAEEQSLSPNPDTLLLGGLFSLATVINPHLPPTKAEQFWESITQQPCYSQQTDTARKWITLFQAIARRDGQKMGEIATQLVEQVAKDQLKQPDPYYLLTTSLLGFITTNDWSKATQFLQTYQKLHGPLNLSNDTPLHVLLLLNLVNIAQGN